MKRQLVDEWTRFLEGSDALLNAEVVPQNVRATLHDDLMTDSLLRARGSSLRADDAPFTAAVIAKLEQTVGAANFTQGVRQRLRRQRAVRRLAFVGAFSVLTAAAAWYLGNRRSEAPLTRASETVVAPTPLPSSSREDAIVAGIPNRGAGAVTTQPEAFLLVGKLPPSVSDALVQDRLEQLGLRTAVRLASGLTHAEASTARLLAISSTVESAAFEGERAQWIAALPIPVVVWEPWLFDDLGLAACEENRGCGRAVAGAELTLPNHGAPLLAWPTGVITVARTPIVISFGVPLPAAITVATAETDETRPVFFVYEQGSNLTIGPSPSRRVALFLADDTPHVLTDDGWGLFDAAITWALGGRSR